MALTALSGLIGQPLPAVAAPVAGVQQPAALLAPPNGPPQNVRVTATGSGSADLAWDAADWGSSTNQTYTVLSGSPGTPFPNCQTITATTCHFTGGAASTVTLFVRALGDPGSADADSSSVTTTLLPPPYAPTGVAVASTGSGTGTVSWVAPSSWRLSTTKKYDVYLDGNVVCHDLAYTVLSCPISGSAGAHTVKVRAIGNTGLYTDSSPATSFSLVVAPDKPTALHLTASDAGSGTLAWTAPNWNGNVHHGYTVTVDGDPVAGCTDITATSCAFEADAINVQATVTAIGDAAPLAAVSDPVTLTLLPAPTAPPNVRAASWTVGGATVLWDPTSFNGSTVNTYTVTVDGDPVPDCTGITATSCVLTGTPDTSVSVVVTANGDTGLATSANALAVELPDLPGAPDAAGVTSRTLGHTVIGWTAPADWHHNAQHHYTVLVGGAPVAACTDIVTLSCDLTGGQNSTAAVKVRAIGNSPALKADASLSVEIPDVPDVPTNVRTTSTSSGAAHIVWDAPDFKHNTNRAYAVTVDGNPVADCGNAATVAACDITGTPGTVQVQVQAIGDDAATLSSAFSPDTPIAMIAVPAGRVSAVTVGTAPGSPTVTVSWPSVIGNGGSWSGGTIHAYKVQIDAPVGADPDLGTCAEPVDDDTLNCSFTADADGEYTATVTAVNEAGPSTDDASGSATLVLHAPTGGVTDLAVTPTPGTGNVHVSWSALTPAGAWHGAIDKKYTVTIDQPDATPLTTNGCDPAGTATYCDFEAATAGLYTVHVKPTSEAGPSTTDVTKAVTVALQRPTAAVADLAVTTTGSGAVQVTWTPIAAEDWNGATHHYQVAIAGPSVSEQASCAALAGHDATAATGCSFTADAAGDYTVTVTAVNEVGASTSPGGAESDPLHVTLDAPEGPVSGLILTNTPGDSTVSVTWDQLADWNDAADKDYVVTLDGPGVVSPNSCTTAPIADSGTPNCSFTVDAPGDYKVTVIARSEAGDSAPADETKHVTLAVPSGTIAAASISNTPGTTSVQVSWPQLTGDGNWSYGATRTYKVTLTDAADTVTTACAGVADGATPTCTFTNSTPGPFTVKVYATNEAGDSTTFADATGRVVLQPTATVSSLTAAQTPGSATVQVGWAQSNPGDWRGGATTAYRVTIEGPAGSVLTPQTCTTADIADSGTPGCSFTASIGGDYVVKVAPVNEVGVSSTTATSATAHVVLTPTAIVTNLRAQTDGGDVQVTWRRPAASAWNGAVTTKNFVVTVLDESDTPLTNDCTSAPIPDGPNPICSFTAGSSGVYTVKVALANEAGVSTQVATTTGGVSLSEPTGKPTAVTVTTTPGSGTVAVTWPTLATPSDWQGQTHEYAVTVSPSAGLTDNTCGTVVTDSSAPQCSFRASTPGDYTVTVAAANETGTSTQTTTGDGYVTLNIPTGPVTGLAAATVPASGVVDVTWTRLPDANWQSGQTRRYVVTVDKPAGAGALTANTCTNGPIADSGSPHCSFTAPVAGDYVVHVVPQNEVPGSGTEAVTTGHVTLAVPSGQPSEVTISNAADSGAVLVSWPQLTGDSNWSYGATRTYKVTLTDADSATTVPCPGVADGASPTCSFTNTTPGAYTVTVFAVNEVGAAATGTSANGAIVFRPTSSVAGLTAAQTPDTATVEVGWTQLTTGWNGGTLRNYRVTVTGPDGSVSGQNCTSADIADSSSPACSFTASVGGDYTVTVVPVNEAGTSTGSATSVVAHVTRPPTAAVSGLVVHTTATSKTVTVTWDAASAADWNGGSTHNYTVTVTAPPNAVLDPDTCPAVTTETTCTFDTTRSGTYTVGVALTNEVGTATPALTATGTVALGAPGTPTGVSATDGATNSTTVSWSAPANLGGGLTSYTVTATATDYAPVTCPGTVTTSPCTITGLAAGVDYTVSVVAVGPEGDSAAGTDTASPVGAVQAPVEVPAAAAAAAAAAGSTPVTGGGTVTITGQGFDPGSTVVLSIYSVPVSLGTAIADTNGRISVTVSLPSGTASGSHTLLASGVDPSGNVVYAAKAVAVASAPVGNPPVGNPPVGNPPVGNPPVNTPPATTPPTPVPPSGAVTALAARQGPATSRTVTVTWSDSGVVWGTGTDRSYSITVDGPGTRTGGSCGPTVYETTCTFTVDKDGSYRVGVSAQTEDGPSPDVTSATVRVASAPGSPTSVRGTAGANTIVVSWSRPSSGTVTRYTATATNAAYPARACTTTGATTCTISGVAAGVPYGLQVTATGAAGTSAGAGGATRPVPSGAAQVPTSIPSSAGSMGKPATVTAGKALTVSASGYKAGTKVLISLYPGPVALATAKASGSGSFTATVFIPRTTRSGQYSLLATGLTSSGTARFAEQPVTVRRLATTAIKHLGTTSLVTGNTATGGGGTGGGGTAGDVKTSAATSSMAVTGRAAGPVVLAGVAFILLGLSMTRIARRRRGQ